jgi:hypothetical protein
VASGSLLRFGDSSAVTVATVGTALPFICIHDSRKLHALWAALQVLKCPPS